MQLNLLQLVATGKLVLNLVMSIVLNLVIHIILNLYSIILIIKNIQFFTVIMMMEVICTCYFHASGFYQF